MRRRTIKRVCGHLPLDVLTMRDADTNGDVADGDEYDEDEEEEEEYGEGYND